MTTTFSLADGLGLAFRHLDEGKVGEAKRMARRIEKSMPNLPGLAYLQGLIAAVEGEDAKAARHFTRALEETPDAPAPLVAMARAQARQDRNTEAETWYRRAVATSPDPATKQELAALLSKRAIALQSAGQVAEARALFAEVAELDPQSGEAAWMLAFVLNDGGDREGAIRMYRRAAMLDPEDKLGARIMLARLGVEAAPDKAPEAFVRTLFDQYADTFDESLTGKLRYRAPELLIDAIRRVIGDGPFDTYDAGCGTGLMGTTLKSVARKLVGSDLSPAMIERARARGIYDTLTTGDFVAELATSSATYDLVTAADVLVYLGDLAPTFAAAARALRPGGGFAFTVERGIGDSWAMGESGRYAHSADYLRGLAAAHGFHVAALDEASTREDRGLPVPGLVCVMRKSK
jgi:predicted TPR repeat methyltransferase